MSGNFENCPITLGFAVMTTVVTLLKGGRNGKIDSTGLDFSSLTSGDLLRFITGNIVFTSTPQLFIGVLLMYTMRQFERQLGSRKFGSFVVASYMLSTCSQIALVTIAKTLDLNLRLSSGPYFFIYSLLTLYYRHVPKLHPSRHAVLSVRFSEKSWTYLFALQLMTSEGYKSVGPSVCGILAGIVYLNNTIGIQSIRLPHFVEAVFSPFRFIFGSPPPPNTSTPNPYTRAPANQPHQPEPTATNYRNEGGRAFMPVVEPPSENDIQTIMNLGFERQQAIQALQATQNNVEAAANNLFSGRD